MDELRLVQSVQVHRGPEPMGALGFLYIFYYFQWDGVDISQYMYCITTIPDAPCQQL